ncbi:Phosphatidyl-myo-inositol dimannoside synthase [Halorhabdus sp. BNX81]|nr:Phosphatidyl-myo-inositol dimannoside synthase [Halorhabdus sp. BNX81]
MTKNLEHGLRAEGHACKVLHLPMADTSRSVGDYIPRPSRLYNWRSLTNRDFPYLNFVYRKTMNAIREFNPDIVHALHCNNWTALVAARNHGIARVLSAHALELQNTPLARTAIGDADSVHVPSRFTENQVCKIHSKAETNVIPPAINVDEYRKMSKRSNIDSQSGPIVCIGRFVDRKNIETVIRSWNYFPPHVREGRELLVVGDGPNRAEIETLASEDDNIRLLGWVSEQTKRELLAKASVFVLVPSRDGYDAEGFGIVYIEAQAAGTPVVGSTTGGVPEAIGNGGLTVEDETDPKAVARAIETMVTNDSIRSEKVFNANQRIEQFDIPAVTEQHVASYRSLLTE